MMWTISFQSLSGVLDVCNIDNALARRLTEDVSIPFRGFRCLQHLHNVVFEQSDLTVSIPFRGFRCLQLNTPRIKKKGNNVSIPFRGFRCLQQL